MNGLIKLANKVDSFQVMVPSLAVGDPLSVFATVIKIEHGGDCIDPKTGNPETVEPAKGAPDQKTPYLGPSVIENQGIPFGMPSQPGILMLEQTGAIEIRQSKFIGREMGRHPIQKNSDARILAGIDQDFEVLRGAIPVSWSVKSSDLIPPGGPVGILAGRQKFNMGKTQFLKVPGQASSQFQITEGPVFTFVKFPRTQMHFVNGKGGFTGIARGERRKGASPILLCPEGMNNGGITRRRLALEGKRIALFPQNAVGAQNPILVFLPDPGMGNEKLPASRGTEGPHRKRERIPRIEITGQVNAPRHWSPYDEGNAIDPVDGSWVRTKLEKGPALRSIVEPLELLVFDDGRKAVRILPFPLLFPFAGKQTIRERAVLQRQMKLEKTIGIKALHGMRIVGSQIDKLDLVRVR